MSTFRPPDAFLPGASPAEAWERWRRRFEIYATATDLASKPPAQQVAILLHVIGDAGLDLYNILPLPEAEAARTVQGIIAAFTLYFKPHCNTTYKRHVFFVALQTVGQSIDEFVADLKLKARDCIFGELSDSLIRDRLICGIRDGNLRERLLREADLTLPQAVDICRADEASKLQTKTMTGHDTQVELHAFIKPNKAVRDGQNFRQAASRNNRGERKFQKRSNAPQQTDGFQKPCGHCGRSHQRKQCPAHNKTCMKCGKKNHFASVSRSSAANAHALQETTDGDDYEEELFLGALFLDHVTTTTDWFEPVVINSITIPFKLDTGAQTNILPVNQFRKFNAAPSLQPTKKIVTAYTGHRLQILGECTLSCHIRRQNIECNFLVADTEAPPILGLPIIEELNLITRVDSIQQDVQDTAERILDEYADVFQGIGLLPGEHTIRIKEEAVPKVYAPRRIPLAMQPAVEKELHRMLDLGIIKRVDEPSDWVHPMVVVTKSDGSVRICIDPRDLNNAIKREHFQLPTLEQISSKLHGATLFTVLDASSAFWQIKLSEGSSRLCTFATPFGRFRFLRLPYGIKSAPEVFQKAMQEVLTGLHCADSFQDDLLLWAETTKEHNEGLRALLEKARASNLKLRRDKTQLAVPEIKYLGHRISSKGVSIDPDRVSDLYAMPEPANRKDLQRFLGMVTYLAKFLPNLSERTNYLRSLLKEDAHWMWDTTAQEEFAKLQTLISSAPVLAFFDPAEQVTLTVDASQHGLGAALLQAGRPVAYASASLTSAQTRYAQIEKELLGIVFACETFHYYTYGTTAIVQTDHKPLLAIVHKSFDLLSPRLQRLLLRLQRYNISLVHVPGKELYVADTLSRAPNSSRLVDTSYLEHELRHTHVHHVVSALPIGEPQLKQAVSEDGDLQALLRYINGGWPKHQSVIRKSLSPYWSFQGELYEKQGLIFRGVKLVVPEQLRSGILTQLHQSHQGIVSTKAKARELFYWPGMSQDIETFVKNCKTCQSCSAANQRESLQPWPIPKRPWERICVDFLKLEETNYLLMVDSWSKFAEMHSMTSTTAPQVIAVLKSIFSRHGIPAEVVSDNGPPFDSKLFKEFQQKWNFKHITVSPLYPQSNGMIERSVGTVKNLLRKAKKDGQDLYLTLLNYRTTPLPNLPSPAEMLMGRRLRTLLPTHPSLLKPHFPVEETKQELIRRQQNMVAVDKSTKSLPPLRQGQPVWLADGRRNWKPATVTTVLTAPRSYNVTTSNGNSYRRNRIHLKPAGTVDYDFYDTVPETVTPPTVSRHSPQTSTETDNRNTPVSNRVIPAERSQSRRTPAVAELPRTSRTRSGREVKKPQRLCY